MKFSNNLSVYYYIYGYMAERQAPVWWGIPKRFSERGGERKISWLELFYDLVYAAAISQLTDYLAKHHDLHALGYVLFLFTFLYWSWFNGSLYHDLHGNGGVRSRITMLWQMMSVSAVAVTIPAVFIGEHRGFAISFTIVEILITYLWWSTGYYDPAHKPLNRWYVFCYTLSAGLFFASIFVPYHTALSLWIAALISNYSAGVLSTRRTQAEMLKRHESFTMSNSMMERLGLFTMIVLGEALLGIIHGLGACAETSAMVWGCFLLAILVAFLLWWIYFDMLGESTARPGYFSFLYLSFGYIPLLASFAVIGASLRVMLSDVHAAPDQTVRYMFGISVTIILLFTVAISVAIKQDAAQEKAMYMILRLILAISVLTLGVTFAGCYVSLPVYLGLMAATLLTSIIFAFRVWQGFGLFTNEA